MCMCVFYTVLLICVLRLGYAVVKKRLADSFHDRRCLKRTLCCGTTRFSKNISEKDEVLCAHRIRRPRAVEPACHLERPFLVRNSDGVLSSRSSSSFCKFSACVFVYVQGFVCTIGLK